MNNILPQDTTHTVYRSASGDTVVMQRGHIYVVTHDLVQLRPTINNQYLYVTPFGDTVALEHNFIMFGQHKQTQQVQRITAFDTIQPNSTQHPACTGFEPYYPLHYHAQQSHNDEAYHAGMFPILIFISVAYIFRCWKLGSWSNLFREILSA